MRDKPKDLLGIIAAIWLGRLQLIFAKRLGPAFTPAGFTSAEFDLSLRFARICGS
jgi:hypothetical protein